MEGGMMGVAALLVTAAAGLAALSGIISRVHAWFHERKLPTEVRLGLPPGDMGWPLLGTMYSFLRAFKSGRPDSFLNLFVTRFGKIGMYKTFMFGSPTILVTMPEVLRQILMDDEHFVPGWPAATTELIGRKSFLVIPYERHRRLRRLTAAPINGHDALSTYLTFIDKTAADSLEKWSSMGEIEFLTEIRRFTFRIIIHIFLSSGVDSVMHSLEKFYTDLNYGMRAMAINLPGFAYHKSLKARQKLVSTLQWFLDEKRKARVCDKPVGKDMMDILIEVEDEDGGKLEDDEIIDLLIMYLNAGHESSAHITMWVAIFLQEHPEFLQKARDEQLEIMKNRPPSQTGLTLKDC